MKLVILSCLLVICPAVFGADLEASFADAAWDGVKVPAGQQCGRFEGKGVTPALEVRNIPSAANLLVLEFSDRSYPPMDNGGHGKVGFNVEPGVDAVEVPSAPGHTTDLPPGFSTVAEHQAPTWDTAGAYLPPCSGGGGNSYYLTVKAVHQEGGESHELASVVLEMGKY